ncbi:MAG TPA: (d)CMP kinase [Acidimicrobiales bacterium]|nr:(d)CMP kinase [Acidimicrobiales bacterium]
MRVIAIDGPAGSGKSTVARRLAERLGLDYLDTGAMYRSVALAAMRQGVSPGEAEALGGLAATVAIEAGGSIRTAEVTKAVSAVAAVPAVRAALVARQRQWVAEHGGGVVEGRDIGTVVCPDAQLKVFLTANDDERARRRGDEVGAADYAAVQQDLARRDRLDSTRQASPLKPADDALVIDTTGRSVEEIVEEVLSKL